MAAKHLGLTPPIASSPPTARDLELNDQLLEELKKRNNFEAPEETEKRTQVLRKLEQVTTEFVQHVGKLKGLPPNQVANAGGKVSTFGSYRLGVYGPGSDIDTLVIAPRHVTRADFFEHFPTLLKKHSAPGAIEEMTPVTDAFTPIIKLEYSGISIDLLFARLSSCASVPKDLDLKDTNLLRGLDDADLRSVNGTRVTDEIIALVPQVRTFRLALRGIKLWAKKRALYGNIVGFPGGVAWAMMVARICQLYPLGCGSLVISKFFNLMLGWPWPRPVMLKQIEDGPLQVRVWNPQIYPGDKRHVMPILTPAYPSMCATHNITRSNKAIIMQEWKRAHDIIQQILDGKKTWADLFEKETFFTQGYKYYLSIIAAAKDKEAHAKWSGLVESKVRRLIGGIETSDAGVELAHPYNKGFERVHRCKNEEEVDKVCQGELDFQVKEIKTQAVDLAAGLEGTGGAIDGTNENSGNNGGVKAGEGEIIVYTKTFYVGIKLADGSKKLDISYPVSDFKRTCTESPDYDPDMHSVRVTYTRNFELPDDVFEAGEVRAQKTKKPKNAKGKSKNKKRDVEEAGLESSEAQAKRQQVEQATNGTAAVAT